MGSIAFNPLEFKLKRFSQLVASGCEEQTHIKCVCNKCVSGTPQFFNEPHFYSFIYKET